VVSWGDNDDVGRDQVDRLGKQAADHGYQLHVLVWPEGEDKDDAADFVERGGTPEQARALVELAAPWAPSGSVEAEEPLPLAAMPVFPTRVLPPAARHIIEASTLPRMLLAGAFHGALSVAIGANSIVEFSPTNHQRQIYFIVLLAASGAGKDPSMEIAYAPIVEHDAPLHAEFAAELEAWQALPAKDRRTEPRPTNKSVLESNFTIEALIRKMQHQSAPGLYHGELSGLLRGLNQYKQNGGSDRSHLLDLWTGTFVHYTRVGRGGKFNEVDIYIPVPTATICGGLQEKLYQLLGTDDDGMQPRWMVYAAKKYIGAFTDPSQEALDAYAALVNRLLARRAIRRQWVFSPAARVQFDLVKAEWDQRQRSTETSAALSAAYSKAYTHLVRLCALVAECRLVELPADHPGIGESDQPRMRLEISGDDVLDAADWINATLASWAAMSTGTPLSLSMRDKLADPAVDRVIDYVEEHGPPWPIDSDAIRRHRVAGIRTAADLAAVLDRMKASYPGTVTPGKSGLKGGRPPILLWPRPRLENRTTRARAGASEAQSHIPTDSEVDAEPSENGTATEGVANSRNGRVRKPVTTCENPTQNEVFARGSGVEGGFRTSETASKGPTDVRKPPQNEVFAHDSGQTDGPKRRSRKRRKPPVEVRSVEDLVEVNGMVQPTVDPDGTVWAVEL
jgi:hypothetical protein